MKLELAAVILGLLLASGCDSAGPATPSPLAPIPAATTAATTGSRPTVAATATAARPTPPLATGTPTGASPAALAYLTDALDLIQQHALNRDKVDWPAVRAQVLGPELTAQTTADTYPAIEYVLQQLHDNHSSLVRPDQAALALSPWTGAIGLTANYAERKVITVEAGSPADQAGVRAGDAIATLNDAPPEALDATRFFAQLYFGTGTKLGLRRGDMETFTAEIRHDPVDPTSLVRGRRLPGNIGYIAIPPLGVTPVYSYYAGIMQQIIRDVDQPPACGWVVDLQGNTGGSLWPMLAGIGPVLGEGVVGSAIGPDGSQSWSYRNGQVLFAGIVGSQVEQPYRLQQPNPPVAVLTDAQTASAGEAVLVTFRGRPNTRSFGEATYGVPTGNVPVELSDGALLVLTEFMDVDRTGQAYDAPIPPDVPVTSSRPLRGTDKDVVMEAGAAWLAEQPACTAP